jgi:hypothetical protein
VFKSAPTARQRRRRGRLTALTCSTIPDPPCRVLGSPACTQQFESEDPGRYEHLRPPARISRLGELAHRSMMHPLKTAIPAGTVSRLRQSPVLQWLRASDPYLTCRPRASVLPATCQKPCLATPRAAPRGLGSAGSLTWAEVVRGGVTHGCAWGSRCVHAAEASTALAPATANVHDRRAGSSGAAVATARGHARHHASQQRLQCDAL